MKEILYRFDSVTINLAKRIFIPAIRFSLFVVYFWFGILKLVGSSPANPLVANLLEKTLPFLTFEQFIIGFGVYEMLIGILFLIPKMEKFAVTLLLPHMIMTAGPLVLLPQTTWQAMFTPTLEGQYIIKNMLIISGALAIIANQKQKPTIS
jgi:uncharacterized membrane protein YkgB